MRRIVRLVFPFDPACVTRPWRLFLSIAARVYGEILLVPIVGRFLSAALLAVALWYLFSGRPFPVVLQAIFWLAGLLPLVITAEEFFHAACCLGLGMADRLHGLLIGRYMRGTVPVSLMFAAIDMRGQFNMLDRFYLSAAGPVLTFISVLVAAAITALAGGPVPLLVALLLLSLVPLAGLMPIKFILESDGYAILKASRRLMVPVPARVLEVFRSVKFPLRWMLRPRIAWPHEVVDVPEAYRSIEEALGRGDASLAMDWYRRLIAVDPYNPTNHNNLAWLLAEEQRFVEALWHARRAGALAPADPDIQDTLRRIRSEVRSVSAPS